MPRTGARIVITGYGSLGDLSPLITLGVGLRERGHTVVVATADPFREHVERAGLQFHPMRPHLLPDEMLSLAMTPDGSMEILFRDVLFPSIRESYDDLLAAALSADVLISHMLAFAAPLVAAATGLPWISVVLQPLGFLSPNDRIVTFSDQTPSGLEELDATTSRDAWRQGRRMSQGWGEPIRRLRAALGLPPGLHPVYEDHHSPGLVLGLFSKLLAAPQHQPAAARITGFLFDERGKGRLPQTLELFLARGEPPVIVTLGSHTPFDNFGFHVSGALAALSMGRRVVLLGQGTGVHADVVKSLNPVWADSIRAYDFVPYSLVFPQAAAVIHHGGVGTIGACLQAGTPMLLVPMGFDQLHNSWQAARIGSVGLLAAPSFSVATATQQLLALLHDPDRAEVAARMSAVVREEDGLRSACRRVESYWRRAASGDRRAGHAMWIGGS